MNKKVKDIIRAILLSVPFFVVSLIVYKLFLYLQVAVFSSKTDFLFSNCQYLWVTLLAFSVIYYILINGMIQYGEYVGLLFGYYKKLNQYFIFSFVTFIFIGALVGQFFNYGVINEQGIIYRNSAFEKRLTHKWNDVKEVSIYPTLVTKKNHWGEYELRYILNYSDGSQLNLSSWNDFFERITKVDNFIKNKGIVIKRAKINNSQLINSFLINSSYESESLSVIKKLLDYTE